MDQYVVTWKTPDGQPRQSVPRSHDKAYALAAIVLAASPGEVVGAVGEILRRETTRRTKTAAVVTEVRVERWAPSWPTRAQSPETDLLVSEVKVERWAPGLPG